MPKTVMIFGVFDGVHEGHRFLFQEAKKSGDYLIAVVAPDEAVKALKGKTPRMNLGQRLEALLKEDFADEIVAGDAISGIWEVIKTYKPDIVALGYDQQSLKESLESRIGDFDPQPKIVVIEPFEPEKYHSSLLEK